MNSVSRECLNPLNAQTEAEEFARKRLLHDDDLSLRTDHSKFTDTVLTDNGYIEGKELDDFFRHMMKRLGPQVSLHTCDS